MLILRTLERGPQHGYRISRAIQAGSGDILTVETGSLYPALHRLEKQGLIVAEWKRTENKQRGKYYRLTPAGRKRLVNEESRWEQMVKAVSGVMKPARAES